MYISEIKLPSNKKFGYFFSVIFIVSASYSFYFDYQIWLYILGTISLFFLTTTILKPNLLLPLNKMWIKFGLLLGMIVSPIVMAVIFFGIFTPIAIIMRFFGRDELRLHFKKKNSHWVKLDFEDQDKSFKQQF